MSVKLFNTLTRRKENFRPLRGKTVRFYACGPTVYQRAHIGNLRTYINEDILRRTLALNGFKVRHIMNITDVGHLERDSDTGEDKIEKEAKKKHRSAWDIAREFEEIFKADLKKMNILVPEKFPRATGHIKEQINLIKKLEEKGYTYRTEDGVYFDTSRFKNYGVLVRTKLKGIQSGARVSMGDKKNPTDFALWKFSGSSKRQMEWPSPWGKGFPGWHIECSAMSIKYLGLPIDIHAGGVDHIHPHHTNEIAQSEAAFGKKFVNYWVHSEFLQLKQARMGKSEGNAITLESLEQRGFDPLDFRYLTLTASYRSPLSFSWESLSAARTARKKLEEKMLAFSKSDKKISEKFRKGFLAAVNNDLNISKALALVWRARGKDEILYADRVLGLGLGKLKKASVPAGLEKLLEEREVLRRDKKWREADAIRDKILRRGYAIEDTPQGARLKKLGLPTDQAG